MTNNYSIIVIFIYSGIKFFYTIPGIKFFYTTQRSGVLSGLFFFEKMVDLFGNVKENCYICNVRKKLSLTNKKIRL